MGNHKKANGNCPKQIPSFSKTVCDNFKIILKLINTVYKGNMAFLQPIKDKGHLLGGKKV
jgi:hypothetical protein